MFRILDRLILALWRQGLNLIGPSFLVILAIQVALAAISYGISALLAPKPPEGFGPRLDDLGAPVTNPGRAIPKAAGRNIVTGQTIWSTGLVETVHSEKVGGGKGGAKKQRVTTYTYSTSLAIAFNDGEICGVNRILGNGAKTIWSAGFAAELTEADIQVQVTAKYNEVYSEQLAIWIAVIDPTTGLLKYTTAEAESLAALNATNTSEALRDQLTAANADVKPRYSSIEFYYGSEAQDPSPIIEGYEGVGNVSAFKGIAYLVIADLELADFGNFVPSFTIDYATVGDAVNIEFGKSAGFDDAPKFANDKKVFVDWTADKAYITEEDEYSEDTFIHEYDLTTQTFTQELSLAAATYGVTFLMGIDEDTGYLYGWDADINDFYWQVFDPATGAYVTDVIWVGDQTNDIFGTGINHWVIITSQDATSKSVMSFDPGNLTPLAIFHDTSNGAFNVKFSWPSGFGTGTQAVNGDRGEAFVVIWSTAEARVMQYTLSNAGVVTQTQVGSFTPADIGVSAFVVLISANPECHFDPVGRSLHFHIVVDALPSAYWVGYSIDSAAMLYSMQLSTSVGDGNITRMQTRLRGGQLVVQVDDTSEFASINLLTGEVTLFETNDVNLTILEKVAFYDGVSECIFMFQFKTTASGFQQLDKYCNSNICFIDPVSLGDVIRSYMGRSGYAASEYEIDSALDAETIWGFNDNTGRPTREILQDLSRIRPVIVNEIEGKLRFRLADQSISATIPKEDVRAYDGSGSPPEWINEVKTLEDLALPKTLRITYQDKDRALNPATALFTREVTQSTTVEEFAVQAVDTSDAMRNSVFTGMSVLMSDKRTFRIDVPLKYSVLEPGDVITIPVSDTRTAKARIVTATLGANNIIELECSLYIDTSLGVVHTDQFEPVNTDTAVGSPITQVFLLDIPYLTDAAEYTEADATIEDNGIYVAFATRSTGWPGAILYVDAQTLTTENSFGVITQPTGSPDWQVATDASAAVFAGLIGLLPDPTATALVQDTVSVLVVSFYTPGAAFETIASGSTLSTQDNAFLVGNEIIQAETVTLLNTDAAGLRTYQFTNLWRGLQGTEWAIGTQVVGDQVVHLDLGGLQRVDLGNAELIGLTVNTKAVTVGSDITSTSTTSFVYDAASLKPWAPMIEAVVRDGSGNLTFELIQRNRYGSLWTPTDPPFESDPDDFSVDIVVAGSPSPLRTISVSGTSTISYSAAEQTTDFGSTQSAIAVAAYQLNVSGRRGFAREETV